MPLLLVSDQRTKPVSSMTHQERMEEAIRRAHEKGQISDEILRQLPSITDLAIGIVVVGGVLVGLGVAAAAVASTGVGARSSKGSRRELRSLLLLSASLLRSARSSKGSKRW
jgi:uncharacterized membrane protein YedE/YeeE